MPDENLSGDRQPLCDISPLKVIGWAGSRSEGFAPAPLRLLPRVKTDFTVRPNSAVERGEPAAVTAVSRMGKKICTSKKFPSRRARLLYATLCSAVLFAAWTAASTSNLFAARETQEVKAAPVAACVAPPSGMVAWYPGDDNGNGVTVNDAGDADAGANNLQNFPVVTSSIIQSGAAVIRGALNSTANASFRVEFFSNPSCDVSSNGEGQTFLGAVSVLTDVDGNANFSAGPLGPVSLGQFVTATATNDSTGDTSEFSQCVAMTRPQQRTVTNTNDDGSGSLREALNEIADGGTIDFAPGAKGTVTLSAPLAINKRVTIDGPGTNLLTLSGNNQHRVFNVEPGGEVGVSQLSFSNGNDGSDGGAILNSGKLTLTNCSVSKSNAGGRGGAIFNSASGTLNLDRSTISANSAGQGGGVYNAGTANVSACNVSANIAPNVGGGIFNGTGTLNLVNSTVSGNLAGARGGGVANEGGTLSITASTVSGNQTNLPGSGGGISNGSGTLSLRSSIVAANFSGVENNDLFGTFNSQGFNLVGVVGAGVVLNPPQNGGDQVGTLDQPLDARLGSLQNNGGPTDTRALQPNSPALDAGDVALSTSNDQRGVRRNLDQGVDIGAFENRGSVAGIVLLREANTPLEAVTLTLSGDSTNGEHIIRTAQTGPAVGNVNYTFMDVPDGRYTITPQELRFTFEPRSLDIDLPGAQIQSFFGARLACPTSNISGRIVGPNGEGLAGVTLTLSGPKTVVLTTPGAFDCPVGSDPGSFCFGNVTSGTGYTVTPTTNGVVFKVVEESTGGTASGNGRGGADIPDLGGTCGGPGFVQGMDFDMDAAIPTPTPTPSDDFTTDTTDPNRFRLGVLSLETDAFEQDVRVVQGKGQLQITPRAKNDAQTAPLDKRFNGYVSVRDIDLNSSTSISVRADQPLATDGAQTVFSAGSDLNNFYRIRVADAAQTLDPARSGSKAGSATAAQCAGPVAAGTPAIFFEAFIDGRKHQGAAPDCAEFRRNTDVFWRLRLEPRTETPPAACNGVDARAYVLFETSVDRSTWSTRYCAPVGVSRPNVAAELLAGILGNSTRDPGTAKFSDYRVADRTGIGFHPSNPLEVEQSVRNIELKLIRDGDVSSAASVVFSVSGRDVASSTRTVFFKAGESTANVSFPNPVAVGTEGNTALTLKLTDAAGGALNPGADSAPLIVNDDFEGSRLNDPVFFTSQQYCDFLNRPPDAEGLAFWSGQFEQCNRELACMERERVHVSAAFFLSIEFQQTSYFVYRLYHSSFGRMPRRDEFMADTRTVGNGVVVGQQNWQEILETNKRDFLNAWVQRPDFRARFGPMNSAQYVDAIYASAGVPLSANERTRIVLELLTAQRTRTEVLASLVESDAFVQGHFNRAFVLSQYFGYLQRDPDTEGFNFWLQKLDDFQGDFVAAEMVKAFINSDEYRNRFMNAQAPSCF